MKIILSLTLFFAFNFSFASDHVTWEGKYGTKYVYIKGLEADLFQKYVIKDSKGPKWGHDVDEMSSLMDSDFYEWHTYWAESGYPEESCPDFSEEDFENAYEDGYWLKWQAVKRKKGSKKTVYYLARLMMSIYTGQKSCEFTLSDESEAFVVLNPTNKSDKPQFLGQLSLTPKPAKK